jgi:hypothetical protein
MVRYIVTPSFHIRVDLTFHYFTDSAKCQEKTTIFYSFSGASGHVISPAAVPPRGAKGKKFWRKQKRNRKRLDNRAFF